MRSVRDFVDKSSLIILYRSLVEPCFLYCSTVWDSLGIGLSAKLQKLQNRAARIINRSDCIVRSVELLKQLNWQTHSQKRIFSKAIMMYKVLNCLAPDYLRDRFSFVCQRHKYT